MVRKSSIETCQYQWKEDMFWETSLKVFVSHEAEAYLEPSQTSLMEL